MLLLLFAGLSLWMVYGFIRADIVIIIANAVSLTLLGCILYFKFREQNSSQGRHEAREQ